MKCETTLLIVRCSNEKNTVSLIFVFGRSFLITTGVY